MSLPSGYTRLEYIESQKNEFIDTGFVPNQDTRVVMDAQYIGAGTTSQWFFGVRDSSSLKFDLCIYNSKTKVYDGYIAQNTTYTITDARHTYDKNKNVTSIDGATVYTFTAGTISLTHSMYLFALNNAGETLRPAPSKLYSCQIYDNGTLVRDFIPARNASGVVGLWDDVNSVFYTNAGTGTFLAGELPTTAHKTLIDGTEYSITGGKCLVDGTEYSIQKGRVLVGGTGFDITFAPTGVLLAEIPEKTVVYLNENGTKTPFYVVKHDYESGLNGTGRTLLVRKDGHSQVAFDASANTYDTSAIDTWFNGTYKALLDPFIQTAIATTKFYYLSASGYSSVRKYTLERAIFAQSYSEIGGSSTAGETDGSALGVPVTLNEHWLRTPYVAYSQYKAQELTLAGSSISPKGISNSAVYARPMFTLPADILVDEDMNIIAA